MLISVGNYDMNVADGVINLITKNPYKFPRPSDMSPIIQIGERKEPAVPFTFTMSFIYEKCMGFLLKRLAEATDSSTFSEGIKRTIFLYPWQFTAYAWLRTDSAELSMEQLRSEVIPNSAVWSKFFYLEISEAIIKYKEKQKSG